MLLLLIPPALPMQNQHLAIKWKILWNITILKFSQFYDGACEETPRKHSEAGESRAGCPTFFLLKKAASLTFPEGNGAELTRRNGTDSGRPFVRPSVVIVVNARSRRPKQTDGQGQTDGRTTVLSCVAHQSRPSADTPHSPRTAQETTDQLPTNPLTAFRSIMWAHPPTPRPPRLPGRPVPPPPGLVLLTGPKLPFPATIQTTNKQTDWNVRLPHPSRTKLVAMASNSQRPLGTHASARVSE